MMDYRNNHNNENETNNENMMAAEQNSFNGKKPSSKNKKAKELQVPILTEEDFLKTYNIPYEE
mgnify:CR=1 FL=1